MTERKPPQMKFRTWIDEQVSDAERRGVFDNLPGAGKPLNLKPRPVDGDYGAAWARDYAQREGVALEDMLPTPLRLRREIERLAASAGEFRTEAEVREAAADLNRRIVEWRRIPVGPPIHVRLVNADDLVSRWRAAEAARAAQARQAPGGRAAPDGAPAPRDPRGRLTWPWRRRPLREVVHRVRQLDLVSGVAAEQVAVLVAEVSDDAVAEAGDVLAGP
jgi:hypothetical protein